VGCKGEHAGWVNVAADAINAFNSFCRSQMWGYLPEHISDLATLGRLIYGSSLSTTFNESGYDRSEVLNSAGTRQGCSWGSFLYCLTSGHLLKQLSDEFPSCVILASTDDAHITGPSELAAWPTAAAYERWRFLHLPCFKDN